MIKKESTFLCLLFLFLPSLIASCEEYEDDFFLQKEMVAVDPQDTETGNDGNHDDDELNSDFTFSLYANNSITNQSAAAFEDYLFLVPKHRGKIYMYNLKEKRLLCSFGMSAMTELNDSGSDIYHCNQTTFGADYYEESDPFPLLYISQRARCDRRCFTEVFRIIAAKTGIESEYSSFILQLVQIIYFPPQSESNSMGNVNTVIDKENHLLYTYSRNNTRSDANFRQCKISCFAIPDVHQSEVYLENTDIVASYMIDCSAYCMQGACIQGKYLYIARGVIGVKYIDINVIDLEEKVLKTQLNLFVKGYRWEPEGCFYYNGHLMIATGKNIWELDFENSSE